MKIYFPIRLAILISIQANEGMCAEGTQEAAFVVNGSSIQCYVEQMKKKKVRRHPL